MRLTAWIHAACLTAVVAGAGFGAGQAGAAAATPPERVLRHIPGIIPNYRTAPSLPHYQPLAAKAKFKIAADDPRVNFRRASILPVLLSLILRA
jgi:hypothetical protein